MDPMNRHFGMKQAGRIVLAVFALLAGSIHAAERARPMRSEYEVLKAFPSGRLAALCASDRPDAKGLTGGNRGHGSWLEAGPQRGSCRAVIAAVVAGDLAAADDAWRGIDVAFAHQRADGGFDAEIRPNGKSARPLGAAVETAYFFLQEMGRAILVIRQSPHEAHFRARIAELEPRIRRACMFIDAGYDTIIENSSKAVNRIIIAAKAFGTCGLVLKDDRLVARARALIAHALTLRDSDGVFIEHGGRDSSYNVVSILFGQVLALHLPLPEFEAALPQAVAWQLTKIRDTGEVDVTGNTRTGVGREFSYTGAPKNVNYGEVIFALTYYGLVHQDPAALAAADRVFAYSRRGTTPGYPAEYQGRPFADAYHRAGVPNIPGIVQCALYDQGGEGVAFHDTDSINNGSGKLNLEPGHQRAHAGEYLWHFRKDEGVDLSFVKDWADLNHTNLVSPHINQLYIGWTENGEWCNYTVNVARPGTYRIRALYSFQTNVVTFDLNGRPAASCRLPVPTANYHQWNVATIGSIAFPESGRQLLTFHYGKGNNFAYFEFEPVDPAQPVKR